jgi:glycosyltransferase involved in cell wall biosynthesis
MSEFMVCNSRAVADELVTIDHVPSERVTTIYNGVNTMRFRPSDRSLRNEHKWGDDNVVFGIIANFYPYKRHIDFVRAAALIADRAPHARFFMAGEDRGSLASVKAEVRRYSLEEKFAIIPGMSNPERAYPSLDVYICPSQSEGLSNVLLEASACAVPIIATRVGGNPEIVKHGENGFLIDVSDHNAIADFALKLIQNQNLRRTMGAKGRALVEHNFSISKMVRNYELLYTQLLAAHKCHVVDFVEGPVNAER